MRHGLLDGMLYINRHSKMEHFECAFIPKVPAQGHCKTDLRICLMQTSCSYKYPGPYSGL